MNQFCAIRNSFSSRRGTQMGTLSYTDICYLRASADHSAQICEKITGGCQITGNKLVIL